MLILSGSCSLYAVSCHGWLGKTNQTQYYLHDVVISIIQFTSRKHLRQMCTYIYIAIPYVRSKHLILSPQWTHAVEGILAFNSGGCIVAYRHTTYNRWAVLTNCSQFDDYFYIFSFFNLKICIYTVLTILLLSHRQHYYKHAVVTSWM